MGLSEHVFLYCERGTSAELWAEPFNAASNGAFLLAAIAGLLLLLRRKANGEGADQFLFVALVFLIGLGSLAFHLFATGAAELADVTPIDVFMLVYLGFALNRFLGVPPGWTVLLLIGFTGLVALTMQLKCWSGAIGFAGPEVAGAGVCFNGSLVYLPALSCHARGRRDAARAGSPGCALSAVGRARLRHLGDAALARFGAVRCLYHRREEGRHPFRLAFVERGRALPAHSGEPVRGPGGRRERQEARGAGGRDAAQELHHIRFWQPFGWIPVLPASRRLGLEPQAP